MNDAVHYIYDKGIVRTPKKYYDLFKDPLHKDTNAITETVDVNFYDRIKIF